MLTVKCSGSPYEIGQQHGSAAKDQVHGSLAFYRQLFRTTCGLDWCAVTEKASEFLPQLETLAPSYCEELRGLASAAGVEYLDILAINLRTEITFGLWTDRPELPILVDGCTSMSYMPSKEKVSLLCQNWDWQREQTPNLIVCHVSQPSTPIPDLVMVTEAGTIGKIGFNAAGVGVCINAIRARGVDNTKLPVHFALRRILESPSRAAAVAQVCADGTAGSMHMLVADVSGATGLECTSAGVREMHPADVAGDKLLVHANHLLLEHPGVDEPPWLEDSAPRVCRLRQLVEERLPRGQTPDAHAIFELFKDEQGWPAAINRAQEEGCETETLFNIIMNLTEKKATVAMGKATAVTEIFELSFPSRA